MNTRSHTVVADAIVQALCELGCSRAFGVPGGAIEPLLNAFSQHASRIRFVHARHESGAAYMAHGYSLASNAIGVCCATTGPGATNLITGVSSAYLDHMPMLVLTGQNSYAKTGRPALQDSTSFGVDTVEIFKKCTKFSTLVPSAEVFPSIFAKAIQLALTPPYGPVHLSIPTDVLKASVAPMPAVAIPSWHRGTDGLVSLCAALSGKKVAFYIGRRALGHRHQIEAFLTKKDLPYVCSPQGKSAVTSTLRGCAGVFGFCGHESAHQLIESADVVLSIGANMEELSTNGWDKGLCGSKLYCISDDGDDLLRSYGLAHVIDVSVDAALVALEKCEFAAWTTTSPNPYPSSEQSAVACSPNHPSAMLNFIFSMFEHSDVHSYIEAGNSWCWYLHYVSKVPSFIEANFGAMGWALGAGIGACAHDNKITIVVSGDGSFLMNGNELSVAVEQRLPVLFVVMNDGGLGMVRHGQRLSNSASIGHQFPRTSYAAMASAMGCRSAQVSSLKDLAGLDWAELKIIDEPFVIDVRVDPDISPPMGRRIESLMK